MKSFIYSASHFKECVYFPLSVLDLRSMVQGSSSICGLGVYLVRCSLWKLLYQVVIYQALAQFWYFHNKILQIHLQILQIHLFKRRWSDLPNLFESDTFQVTFGWLFFFCFVFFKEKRRKKKKKRQLGTLSLICRTDQALKEPVCDSIAFQSCCTNMKKGQRS